MKVAFVHQPMFPAGPGDDHSIGIWTREIGRRLTPAAEVTVFSPARRTGQQDESYASVRYRYVPRSTSGVRDPSLGRFRLRQPERVPEFFRPEYFGDYAWKVATACQTGDYDVVHLHNFAQYAPLLKALCPRTRVVLHMHCDWLSELDAGVVAEYLGRVDCVLGCSRYVAQGVAARFPEHALRIGHIHCGVDLAAFRPGPRMFRGRDSYVVLVGRVSPEKGLHDLIAAMPAVLRHHPQAVLEVIGPIAVPPRSTLLDLTADPRVRALEPVWGEHYRGYLRRLLRGLPRRSWRYLGNRSHRQVAARVRRASVVVAPSVWHEPFGMPVVEAMASGIPVVATAAGGFNETVVPGVTGLLVERGDVGGLTRALVRVLDDPELAARMGEAGRRRALECFSWQTLSEAVRRWYVDLCAGVGSSGQGP